MATNLRSAFWGTAGLQRSPLWAVAILFLAPPYFPAADEREPVALLRACLETQSRTDKTSMRVNCEQTYTTQNSTQRRRFEAWIRRNGAMLDVASRTIYVGNQKGQSFRNRTVLNGDLVISYQVNLDRKDPPTVGIVSRDSAAEFEKTVGTPSHGFSLDGYMSSAGGRRLAETMQSARDVRLLPDEVVDGAKCKVVTATIPFGVACLWLDPSQGYISLRALLTKGPDDPFFEGPLRQQPKFHSWPKSEYRVKWTADVRLQKVIQSSRASLPAAGKQLVTLGFSSGRSETAEYVFDRSQIQIDPDFGGTDAFTTDLPSGSRVNDANQKNASGVVYVWQDGKVVPAMPDDIADVTDAETTRTAVGTAGLAAWTAAAVLVVGTAIFAAFKVRLWSKTLSAGDGRR